MMILIHGSTAQSVDIAQAAFGSGPFVATDRSNYALWRNPAGITVLDGWRTLLGYRMPYGIPELQSLTVAIHFPWKPNTGFSYTQTGTGPLTTRQLALSTGILLDKLSLGAKLHYWQLGINDTLLPGFLVAGFGIQLELNKKILLGITVDNLTLSQTSVGETPLMTWYSGISWKPASHLELNLEAGYFLGNEWLLTIGIEYLIKQRFAVRTGFNAISLESFFSLGFLLQRLELDYAVGVHPYLGISQQAAGGYSWNE